MKLNKRLIDRRIGAAAVSAAVISCGGLAWTPAALAAPTVASATTVNTAQSATHSAALTPETAGSCQEWLQLHGYTVTLARATACHVAALGKPNMHAAIAACSVALVATKVSAVVAATACAYGAIPG